MTLAANHPTPRIVLYHAARRQWLEFRQPRAVLQAWELDQVLPALAGVQEAVERDGLWAVGFVSYEAAPACDAALQVRPAGDFPLAWFGLFEAPALFELPALGQQEIGMGGWQPTVSQQEYTEAIRRIKDHIARGDTYQVNYTLRLRVPFAGDAWELFLRLAHAQQSQYAAFLDLGRFAICSASPELFFQLDGQQLLSKPMKGTTGRGLTLAQDAEQAEWLHSSEKNRAENVMIVDMIRNDMGRVAQPGSVTVPELFQVERYPTVWQMTSTVASQTPASFVEIMQALFPCASITGAPKARTMQIIAELETTPRQVYTGCIGFYAPGRQAQFNVAIRSVLVDRQHGLAEYGVGGGIVWDSTSADEYQECMVKARVLTHSPPVFELLESMLWDAQGGFFLLEGHLQRLGSSAEYFGFAYEEQRVRQELEQLVSTLPGGAYKVRLLLAEDGRAACTAAPLDPAASARPVQVALAAQPVNSKEVFLYHKTTWRRVYEAALAAHPAAEDVLLWNERRELTETCLGNLVVKSGDGLYTPPVVCGLLPGVFRAHLLAGGLVQERIIHLEELPTCEAVFVVNSVRGMRRAVFQPEA